MDRATTVSGRVKNITSGSVLARNVLLNLLGQVAPLFAAIFTFPRIIKSIGTDRFGILSLAWVVIGYFSLFDFGLSRALTKLVAEKIGTDRDQDIPSLVWTASILILILGVIGVIGICFWGRRDDPPVRRPRTRRSRDGPEPPRDPDGVSK